MILAPLENFMPNLDPDFDPKKDIIMVAVAFASAIIVLTLCIYIFEK